MVDNDEESPTSNESSKDSSKKSSAKPSSSSSSSRRRPKSPATSTAEEGTNSNSNSNGEIQFNGFGFTAAADPFSDNNHLKLKKKKKKRRSSSLVSDYEITSDSENNNHGGVGVSSDNVETTTTATGGAGEKKLKKKKSKQREKGMRRASSSNSLISEVDFGNTNINNSAASSSSVGGGDKKLRDSLTLTKESKQRQQRSSSSLVAPAIPAATTTTSIATLKTKKSGNDQDDQGSDADALLLLSKQPSVQFTSSTLRRESDKIVKQVMGIPKRKGNDDDDAAVENKQQEDEEDAEAGGGGDTTSVKSSGSASSGGSALKKTSKYGGSGGGLPKRTSFTLPGGDDNDNDDDETKDAADSSIMTNPSRGKFDLRPSFKLSDDDGTSSNNAETKQPTRGTRKEMFQRAANNSSATNSSSRSLTMGDGRGSRRSSAPPLLSGPSLLAPQDDDNDHPSPPPKRSHSMNDAVPFPPPKRSNSMNELNQRPVISRRNSCKSILDEIEGNTTNHSTSTSRRSSVSGQIAQKINVVKGLTNSQHKQLRRVRMSMEKQIFIPPKNRNKSVFSAVAHLMAGRVVDCVLWTYQAGFGKVMLLFLTFYVVNIFLWAGIIDAVDRSTGGRCIHDESFDPSAYTSLERYEFAFELSWTTFTTVGYGAIGPASDVPGCYPIRLVCAFVAFTGVLFGSTTAAIMYSKLMRLLAKAHVTFSSTLCVQYGKGNERSTERYGQFNFRASVAPAMAMKSFKMEDLMDGSDSDEDKREESGASDEGFPVIEFRMVNDRANHAGSEIWDAQISGIIQLKKDVNPSTNRAPNVKATVNGRESTLDLDKKAYYQFALTPDSHPHFSRIWYARHVLNAESPLLKREIRDMIVQDGGKWDKDFNTASEIRQCLNEFISLRITLSGTSAVSANTVFAEHVYEYEDVVVGWRFANMVYEKEQKGRRLWKRLFGRGFGGAAAAEAEAKGNSETYTKVDKALIHDIVPQPGDDYEDLLESSVRHHLTGLFKRS